jgi:hypothetical protein
VDAASAEASDGGVSRRSFLATGVAVGVGAGLGGFGGAASALADKSTSHHPGKQASHQLSKGDEAILRFLAAAEIIEADLWQQYNELGGIQDGEVPGGSGSPAYVGALEVLDSDMSQYIHDNTDDELSHVAFINAFLASRGGQPVDLNRIRTLPSSKASGAQQIGRLTNLMELTSTRVGGRATAAARRAPTSVTPSRRLCPGSAKVASPRFRATTKT